MIINKFRYIFVTLLLLVGGVFLSQAGFKVNAQEKLDVIPNNFIVVLKDNVGNPQDVANEMARTHGLSVEHVYTTALKGFSATIPQARLDKVKGDGRVQFVSGDRIVEAFTQTTPTGISRVNASANTNKGTGVGVAVIDTGIDLTHPDLQANIVANKSCIRGKKTGNDDNGHGSHVAGTIAALNNDIRVVGVSPEAKLIAVKVLNSAG